MPNARINCFVDTNILLYTRDLKATEKSRKASQWIRNLTEVDALMINLQVISEFSNAVIKKFQHINRKELRDALVMMSHWRQANITHATIMKAFDLQGRVKASWCDSMLLASAIEAGCTVFVSEDQQNGRSIDGMRIVNPFEVEPLQVLKAN